MCNYKSVVFVCLLGLTILLANAEDPDCNNSDSPISCNSGRAFRNVMQHVLKDNDEKEPLILVPGLEIIEVPATAKARALNDVDNDNNLLTRIGKYLQTHEIKIKFPELMDKADFKQVVASAVRSLDDGKDVVEGRKKDKGGLGAIMLMGLMMGKMMAALGLGGVAALAAKALGVSLMALMLAAIIGIKKLVESGHDDGGHHVQYVTAHEHHRKRREIDEEVPLPYRGWSQYEISN